MELLYTTLNMYTVVSCLHHHLLVNSWDKCACILQSSAVITWSNKTWYCIHRCWKWGRISIWTLKRHPIPRPNVTYGVSFVNMVKKFDRVISALHCTIQCSCNTFSFLQHTCNRHPIAQPWGQDSACHLWVPSITVECCYTAVIFIKNIHKRHTIAHPFGLGIGCFFCGFSLWLIFCICSYNDVCNILLYWTAL